MAVMAFVLSVFRGPSAWVASTVWYRSARRRTLGRLELLSDDVVFAGEALLEDADAGHIREGSCEQHVVGAETVRPRTLRARLKT
jgi:hypothetical protein